MTEAEEDAEAARIAAAALFEEGAPAELAGELKRRRDERLSSAARAGPAQSLKNQKALPLTRDYIYEAERELRRRDVTMPRPGGAAPRASRSPCGREHDVPVVHRPDDYPRLVVWGSVGP